MFEEELINSIQLHECIYNKGSNLYRNKIAKEKAWSAVAAEVGKPVKQCQTRWKSLRDRYTKEHLKLSSGSGAPEYSPEWRFTNSMSFLSDYIQPRPTTSNFDTNEGDEYTYEYLSDDLETTFEILVHQSQNKSTNKKFRRKKRKPVATLMKNFVRW
ncbi:transcription factor Adf-1-like [Musca autumnalis]|uniref:transcription factor Adf-1-like n=1 Tax=Musca autumnalis TaxID=221902 RepID=UPI003CF74328